MCVAGGRKWVYIKLNLRKKKKRGWGPWKTTIQLVTEDLVIDRDAEDAIFVHGNIFTPFGH